MEGHPAPERLSARGPLKRIETIGWAALGALCLGAALLFPWMETAGVALGGLLALGNLRCMDTYFARIFRRNGERPRWWHHALYGARFLGLLAALAAAIGWGGLPVVGLVVGLSVPLMAVLLFGALAALRGEASAKV